MRPRYQSMKHLLAFFILVILSVSLACNTPLSGSNEEAVGTSAAQTITAEYVKQTETAKAGPTSTATPIPTQAAVVPTNTAPSTAAAPPTETQAPIPSAPTIIANEDTNCREGPAPEYPRVGALMKGQQSTVVGRHGQNIWWYIENPGKPGQYCWVWGETTSVTGSTANLPIITPPPPPIAQNPSFVAFFAGINACGGPAAIFEIQNTGDGTFKSMELIIEDTTLGEIVHSSTRNSPFFTNPGGCPHGSQNLEPGSGKFIGGVVDDFVNSGDRGGAEIVLCTESGLGGECRSTFVNFTFP